VDSGLGEFLKAYQPSGVLNILGGFGAACLMHAEMNGLSAACFVSIIDSHFVSVETMKAFAPVVN